MQTRNLVGLQSVALDRAVHCHHCYSTFMCKNWWGRPWRTVRMEFRLETSCYRQLSKTDRYVMRGNAVKKICKSINISKSYRHE